MNECFVILELPPQQNLGFPNDVIWVFRRKARVDTQSMTSTLIGPMLTNSPIGNVFTLGTILQTQQSYSL